MNNDDIKKILNDLYALDPALRDHEKELMTIIRTMAIKPDAHFDPAFAADLRARLLVELAHGQMQKRALLEIFAGRSLRYVFLAVAVIAIGVISFTLLRPQSGGSVALNSSKITITTVGANAFGTLGAQGVQSTAQKIQGGTTSATLAPANSATPMVATPSNVSGPVEGMAIMPVIPNYASTFRYVYAGDPISQDQAQLNVLKKIVLPLSADQATLALEQAGFGQINLSSFGGLGMSTVTLSENQSFGYQISLDLAAGTISINQNYDEWPQDVPTPLTASDMPSDNATITTANQFFTMHGIATTTYGAPEVIHQTTLIVPVAASAGDASGPAVSMPMIPSYSDSAQVLYPLVVNGENVYDANGNKLGITVEVNVRYNRVADVSGLETESYQSSAYDAITNTSTILSMAEKIPTSPIIYHSMNDSAATVAKLMTTYDLGTPAMAYEDAYQTDSNGQTAEFLVPAFVFPVTGDASTSAPQKNIVVPLIQDFEQQSDLSPAIPYNAAASGGTAASGTVASPPVMP